MPPRKDRGADPIIPEGKVPSCRVRAEQTVIEATGRTETRPLCYDCLLSNEERTLVTGPLPEGLSARELTAELAERAAGCELLRRTRKGTQ